MPSFVAPTEWCSFPSVSGLSLLSMNLGSRSSLKISTLPKHPHFNNNSAVSLVQAAKTFFTCTFRLLLVSVQLNLGITYHSSPRPSRYQVLGDAQGAWLLFSHGIYSCWGDTHADRQMSRPTWHMARLVVLVNKQEDLSSNWHWGGNPNNVSGNKVKEHEWRPRKASRRPLLSETNRNWAGNPRRSSGSKARDAGKQELLLQMPESAEHEHKACRGTGTGSWAAEWQGGKNTIRKVPESLPKEPNHYSCGLEKHPRLLHTEWYHQNALSKAR